MEHSAPPVDDGAISVTVYGKPDCTQCDATKLRLNTLGIPFVYRDLVNDEIEPEERAAVDELGYTSAPIVVVAERGEETVHWSLFRLDHIRALAARIKAAK